LKGGRDAPYHLSELFGHLVRLTVLEPSNNGAFKISQGGGSKPTYVISGWNDDLIPVPLRDGNYLKCLLSLGVSDSRKRLYVAKASYQYQMDAFASSKNWIFRYDYIGEPKDIHPPSHLQLRGSLAEDVLPKIKPLERIHFPTRRVSFESILRMLIVDFDVGANAKEDIWREAFAASEEEFLKIAAG